MKLENLQKDFSGVQKQSIAKRCSIVQEEKKVLRMRQVLAKNLVPHLESQIRQNWMNSTVGLYQSPKEDAKFLTQKRRKFG